jgi:hypothetical protein
MTVPTLQIFGFGSFFGFVFCKEEVISKQPPRHMTSLRTFLTDDALGPAVVSADLGQYPMSASCLAMSRLPSAAMVRSAPSCLLLKISRTLFLFVDGSSGATSVGFFFGCLLRP